MRKLLLTRLLILILLAALTWTPASADVIWEPNDSFYERNSEDCEYDNRYYTADGMNGSVSVFKEPGSKETAAVINNGNKFYVSFTYTNKDSAEWGVVMFNPDSAGNIAEQFDYTTAISGWIRMAELKVVYDHISFAEDHESEFKPYTGNYEEFKKGGPVVFWSYPGSGVVAWEVDAFEYEDNFDISDTYTDDENRLWGYVGYFYGARNTWVCVSDPSGASIEKAPPSALPEATSDSPDTKPPTVGDDQKSGILLIVIIVAAVVIVTGVLIAVFWKKSAKKDGAVK